MCRPNSNIQFCTCVPKSKGEIARAKEKANAYKATPVEGAYEKTYFQWIIKRTLKETDPEEWGMTIGAIRWPTKYLDEELTDSYVLELLNNGASFDFEYIPQQKDELTIELVYKYDDVEGFPRPLLNRFLSFVFIDKKWDIDIINHFDYDQEEIRRGKMNKI